MTRRRGDAPPDPFDALDTGRDHITSPHNKNDDRDHSAKNRIATAAAPINTPRKDSAMSVISQSTAPAPPTGFTRISPSEADSAWSGDDLNCGCDFDVEWTREHGVRVHAYGQPVGVEDVLAAVQDLLAFYVRARNAIDEDTRNRVPRGEAVDKIASSLEDFYRETDEDQRPDVDRICDMAEQLHDAGLDLTTATADELNRLARGESL